MPLSNADIPSDVLTARLADLPMVVAARALSSPKWVSGSYSGTDYTDAATPVSRLTDSCGVLYTRGTSAWATARSTVYLAFTLTGDIDCVAVAGHNFVAVGAVTVSLELSADAAFTTPLEVALWTDFVTPLLVATKLSFLGLSPEGNPQRISGATHGRIKITRSGTFPSAPAVGELLIGTLGYLPAPPSEPFDAQATVPDYVEAPTASGALTRIQRRLGHRRWDLTLIFPRNADIDAMKSEWFSGLESSTLSVVLVLNPMSDPDPLHARVQPEMDISRWNPSGGEARLLFEALPPYA